MCPKSTFCPIDTSRQFEVFPRNPSGLSFLSLFHTIKTYTLHFAAFMLHHGVVMHGLCRLPSIWGRLIPCTCMSASWAWAHPKSHCYSISHFYNSHASSAATIPYISMESHAGPRPSSSTGRRSTSHDRQDNPDLVRDFREEAVNRALAVLEAPDKSLADADYERYKSNLRTWEKVPQQYRIYLDDLIKCIAIENSLDDPWICSWVDDRAVYREAVHHDSEQLPFWNFAKFPARRGIESPNQAEERDSDEGDFFSFGKRATVMEFSTDRNPAVETRYSIRTQPTVKEVVTDLSHITQPSGLRWIHLPANNMFWVEVCGHFSCTYSTLTECQTLVNAIYENDPDTTAEQTLEPAILGHRFWQAARQEAKYVETQFDHRPYARFMPPTCLKAGIGNLLLYCEISDR